MKSPLYRGKGLHELFRGFPWKQAAIAVSIWPAIVLISQTKLEVADPWMVLPFATGAFCLMVINEHPRLLGVERAPGEGVVAGLLGPLVGLPSYVAGLLLVEGLEFGSLLGYGLPAGVQLVATVGYYSRKPQPSP